PDMSCEWSAGANYCASCATGVDPACPSPLSQCGLRFVTSRQSADVTCDSTNNFRISTATDIDGTMDGPDFGLINAPLQSPGGQEAIDDTAIAEVQVAGGCVVTSALCSGVATFGSHFRHAPGSAATTGTTIPTP